MSRLAEKWLDGRIVRHALDGMNAQIAQSPTALRSLLKSGVPRPVTCHQP